MITAEDRERALAKRHHTNMETLNEHVKELKPLKVGQAVLVQNQAGNHGKRLARTGTVVETGPGPRQYAVRMDGSRNVSIGNRKFLRTFTMVADMMAEDVDQTRRSQSATVDQGGGDNGWDIPAEQVPLSAHPQGQSTGVSEAREEHDILGE